MKELRIPHDPNDTPQTYTQKVERYFKEHGLDLHMNDVEFLEDDFKKGERIIKAKNRKYFVMGGS